MTTIAAFLPMLVTKGVMGQFIRWIPIMVSIALVVSLIESFFLLPSRLQFTLLEPTQGGEASHHKKQSPWFDSLRQTFERFMGLCIRRRYVVFGVLSLLLVSSIALARYGNRFELFPTDDVEYYFSGFAAPITTNLEAMDKITKGFQKKQPESWDQKILAMWWPVPACPADREVKTQSMASTSA